MKKLFLLLLLAAPQYIYAQKLERYCDVMAIGKMFSKKVTITVDYGEESGFFKDQRVKDDAGDIVKFNSLVDALNYMGTQSWKLVNAFPISDGTNSSVLHFYFKKEYDASELVPKK
jgi:hypothetical protein